MLTLTDNYDSLTYNLVHFLGELGAQCRVYRNDKVSVDTVLGEGPQAIVLSPGPSRQVAAICGCSCGPGIWSEATLLCVFRVATA